MQHSYMLLQYPVRNNIIILLFLLFFLDNRQLVKELSGTGTVIDCGDAEDNTPLMYSAMAGNSKVRNIIITNVIIIKLLLVL